MLRAITSRRARRAPLAATIAAAAALVALPAPARGIDSPGVPMGGRNTVTGLDFLGQALIPTGTTFEGTTVGGLSGITYDPTADEYTLISDDRTNARTYTAEIAVADGALTDGDVTFTDVTTLLDTNGQPFAPLQIDPEAIALSADSTAFISSEGDVNATPPLDPFVRQFTLDGAPVADLPVPEKFLPSDDRTSGVRNNLAFESLTLSPDERFLYTASENALAQDGPAAGVDTGSVSRILVYGPDRQPLRELAYEVEPVAAPPVPAGSFATNGLVELLAIDDAGTLLALERSFSTGVGNAVSLYEVRTNAAVDISTFDSVAGLEPDPPVSKDLVLDLGELGITLDNLEGMTFGPAQADGRPTLIVVSDNNFSATQVTQFLAFAVDIESIPLVPPTLETPRVLDGVDPLPRREREGDSDDPAIWVNPRRPERSRVLGTAKEGGLFVFDLEGDIRQSIDPPGASYNNVDVIEDFALSDRRTIDLAVASDRANDTLAIFEINQNGILRDITSRSIPASIFGVDDGEATAYGLTAYRSPVDGSDYVFVTQASGNQVAQLRLTPDGRNRVTATEVRRIEIPVLDGDPTESQTEGIVADPYYQIVHIAVEDGLGILTYDAEPAGGNDFTLAYDAEDDLIEPDIEGLAIYEGLDGTGYLIVSSQGDSSFAVLDRAPPHAYIGRFVIGEGNGVDSTDESDGLDVSNVPLGPAFPNGLLVAHDGQDDPPFPNLDGIEIENAATNFTYVDWAAVATPLGLSTRHPADRSAHRIKSAECGSCARKL